MKPLYQKKRNWKLRIIVFIFCKYKHLIIICFALRPVFFFFNNTFLKNIALLYRHTNIRVPQTSGSSEWLPINPLLTFYTIWKCVFCLSGVCWVCFSPAGLPLVFIDTTHIPHWGWDEDRTDLLKSLATLRCLSCSFRFYTHTHTQC